MKESDIQTIYFPGLLRNNYFSEAVIIKQNGDVTGCTGYINEEQWICSNVRNTSLEKIIQYDFAKMRAQIEQRSKERMSEECKDCPARRFCRGGEGVSSDKKNEAMCCLIKEDIINFLNQ